jgi:hypothetical protein
MVERIKLVQNDSRPALVCNIVDGADEDEPLNLTDAVVRLRIKRSDEQEVLATIVGSVTNGPLGQCVFYPALAPEMMSDYGPFRGEIEITFDDGQVQTVYDLIRFTVREEF